MSAIRMIVDPEPAIVGASTLEFLTNLGGPSCLFFNGRDQSRTRVMVTLLHGNEPSGAQAVRQWVLSQASPAVNLACFLVSVEAALLEPVFCHRMPPGQRDLNRCFMPPHDDAQGRLARDVWQCIERLSPEAVIDVHNTSGSSPAFAVTTQRDQRHEALASLFTHRLVVSSIRLGTLMEQSSDACPVVTIEAGGREDQAAHELAAEGLFRFAALESLSQSVVGADIELEMFEDSVRLELLPEVSLTYAEGADVGHTLTLRADMEHFNFGEIDGDTLLGWTQHEPDTLFRAVDKHGANVVNSMVRVADGCLYAATRQRLFMVTTSAAAAKSDCLFYSVIEPD